MGNSCEVVGDSKENGFEREICYALRKIGWATGTNKSIENGPCIILEPHRMYA